MIIQIISATNIFQTMVFVRAAKKMAVFGRVHHVVYLMSRTRSYGQPPPTLLPQGGK